MNEESQTNLRDIPGHILTLAGAIVFIHTPRTRGEGLGATPLAVWPLIELELCGKNERVGRYESQRLVPKLNVSVELVTLQVRSMIQMSGFVF